LEAKLARGGTEVAKGWLRCKHGVVLKRGKTVVGKCLECPPEIVAPPVVKEVATWNRWIDTLQEEIRTLDRGVV
jgi:hypothetical protein